MTTTLNGADFVALVRLTDKPGNVLALPGKSCAKVPAASLGWLERKGKIRRRQTEAAAEEPASGAAAAESSTPATDETASSAPARKGRGGRRSS